MSAGLGHFRALPAAAMLLAALVSYLGVPRMVALAPLRNGGLNALFALDLNQRMRAVSALAALDPASEQARELASRASENAQLIDTLCAGPTLLAAPAPALAPSVLSYVAPRVQLKTPDSSHGTATALFAGIATFMRPPPWVGLLSLPCAPLPKLTGMTAFSRAPPLAPACLIGPVD